MLRKHTGEGTLINTVEDKLYYVRLADELVGRGYKKIPSTAKLLEIAEKVTTPSGMLAWVKSKNGVPGDTNSFRKTLLDYWKNYVISEA